MNKHEEVKEIVKIVIQVINKAYNKRGDFAGFLNYESNKVITLPDIENVLTDYITQSEATEKELEGLKEIIAELRREGVVK